MTDLPTARTRPASNWSAIWVLPLIALLIGGWLAWKAYSDAGVEIEVFFESGEGIQAGKTEVIFKGMSIGKVKSLALDDSGSRRGVITTIEMNKDVEPQLLNNSRFWLVKPSVTLAGITGLETLVSGNYIAFSPGEGEKSRKFIALSEPPPLADTAPGLHLTLKAERLGSLNRDSPVFYKQLQVGRVKSYALGKDQKTVEIKVFIEPAYANLVRKHTRFWNASGVTVDASLSGVKVHTESLASIVAGGIAFATPEHREDSPPTDPSLPFRLYDDFDAAQAGIKVKVHFADFEGLQKDGRTPVMFKGIQAGSVKDFKINDDLSGATAELMLDPLIEDYLVEGTEFWVVKPSISLAGITGIDALVKGNYIAIRPGEKGGRPKREFTARSKAPPLDISAPGLHLVLFSDTLGSMDIGSPILYKQLKVGSVQSYQLSRDRQHVVLGVHIEPEYASLVNSSTRFWNASGIKLTGGLSGIEVKSESLQTLLAGGIAFETPDPKAAPLGKRIARFNLSADRDVALQRGEEITIRVNSGDGLSPGTPIRYKGLDVGKIERMELSDDLQTVILNARIIDATEHIARVGSRFWVVKAELGLARTANLDTLIKGQYLEVQPGPKGAGRQTDFTALPQAPLGSAKPGLELVLSTPARGSLKPGVPVTYRDVQVGSVTDFELGPSSDRVLVRILIEPRYAPLVHTGTRFWNTSGIGVDAGLIKGIKIRTDSLESMLEGGVAFATPDNPQMGAQARPGQTFPLFEEVDEEWLKWAPKIVLGK